MWEISSLGFILQLLQVILFCLSGQKDEFLILEG
jgi:hypothetical protein